ncbi:MAG: hypothetical protein NZ955_00750 [Candidatus Bathyarchaeota archaeon]|nr:hypothetical protein [Candidatus Bathyarchaeota archaeon]MCX8161951.1 hypothetical protein [Candidatus Bathyarchaeota archaeon]
MDGIRRSDILEEISRKLDAILERLSLLEQIALDNPRYADSAETLRLTRVFLSLYGEPLKILNRLRAADSYIRRESIERDEISRCIIQALAVKGAMNISAITREVRSMRGKASRRIIRERLKKLEKEGVIKKIDGTRKTYSLIEK